MKKTVIYGVCLLIVSLLLVACGTKINIGEDTTQDTEKSVFLKGKVIDGSPLLVEPIKDSVEINSSDQIYVYVPSNEIYNIDGVKISLEDIKVGDIIEAEYNGIILETYPAKISATNVTVIEESDSTVDESMADPLVEGKVDDSQLNDLTLWGKEINNLDGVSVEIKNVENGVISFTIENITEKEIIFGSDYLLLEEVNGQWYESTTAVENLAFNSEGYLPTKTMPIDMEINYVYAYGQIKKGTYQLVKTALDFKGPGDYTTYYIGDVFQIK